MVWGSGRNAPTVTRWSKSPNRKRGMLATLGRAWPGQKVCVTNIYNTTISGPGRRRRGRLMKDTRTPASGSRSYAIAPVLALFFVALVGLDLLITGIGSPPSNVPPLELGENTGVPVVPSNTDFP